MEAWGVLLAVLGGVALLVLVWAAATYNRFVRLREHMRESWADIDVELKRRYELIPNLVETVRGFAAHEREVLERVTTLRAAAAASNGSPASQAADESRLLRALKQLFAVAEAYPTLRSDAHFLELQRELALTEDRIAAARRFFNANVREHNQLRLMFPTSIIGSMGGFAEQTFFELDSDAERAVPRAGVGV